MVTLLLYLFIMSAIFKFLYKKSNLGLNISLDMLVMFSMENPIPSPQKAKKLEAIFIAP